MNFYMKYMNQILFKIMRTTPQGWGRGGPGGGGKRRRLPANTPLHWIAILLDPRDPEKGKGVPVPFPPPPLSHSHGGGRGRAE